MIIILENKKEIEFMKNGMFNNEDFHIRGKIEMVDWSQFASLTMPFQGKA